MLDKKDFQNIKKEIEGLEEKREEIIRKSRDIITLSKQIIYALHREDISSADSLVKKIKQEKLALEKLGPSSDTNIDRTAFQEYVEAVAYYNFIKHNKIPAKNSMGVNVEDYLCGLCDLTGELVRKAVANLINKKIKEAREIKALVDNLYGEFIKFNLRNSELRKKSDAVRWNLRKLEEVLYDYELKKRD